MANAEHLRLDFLQFACGCREPHDLRGMRAEDARVVARGVKCSSCFNVAMVYRIMFGENS